MLFTLLACAWNMILWQHAWPVYCWYYMYHTALYINTKWGIHDRDADRTELFYMILIDKGNQLW